MRLVSLVKLIAVHGIKRFGLRRFRLCDWSVYYSGVRNAVLREAPEVRSDYF